MTSPVALPADAARVAAPPRGGPDGIAPAATLASSAIGVTTDDDRTAEGSAAPSVATAETAIATAGTAAVGAGPASSAIAPPSATVFPMPPPPTGGSRGIRARVRDHRMAVLRRVTEEADAPLSFDEVAARTFALDGAGIPRRTLFEAPFFEVVTAQVPRRGRLGALSGLPWRLRRLSAARRAERTAELVTRRDALAVMVGTSPGEVRALPAHASDGEADVTSTCDAVPNADEGADEAAARAIRTMLALEAEIAAFERGRGADAARAMLDRLVARRAEASEVAARLGTPASAAPFHRVSASLPAPPAAPTGPRS